MRKGGWFVLVSVVAALVATGGVVAGAIGRAGGTTSLTGGSVDQVRMVRSSEPFKTNGGTWKPIPGAATTVTVPAGHRVDVLARFAGGFTCAADDGSPSGTCSGRSLIGNAEGQPATGTSLAIAQVLAGNGPGATTASVDRSRGPLGPGSYHVIVQERTSSAVIGVEFDSWHLTVERIGVTS
jgi:hypothetical protein